MRVIKTPLLAITGLVIIGFAGFAEYRYGQGTGPVSNIYFSWLYAIVLVWAIVVLALSIITLGLYILDGVAKIHHVRAGRHAVVVSVGVNCTLMAALLFFAYSIGLPAI